LALVTAGALTLLELAVFEIAVLVLVVLVLVVLALVAFVFTTLALGADSGLFAFTALATFAVDPVPLTVFAEAAACTFFVGAGLLTEVVLWLADTFALAFLPIASLEPVLPAAVLLCFAASAFLTEDFVAFSTFTSDLADFAADLTFDEVAFADNFELGIRTLS
jgi:hypothetical protein